MIRPEPDETGADPPIDDGTEWSPEDRLLDEELRVAFSRAKGRTPTAASTPPDSTADDLREFQEADGDHEITPGRWLAEGDRVGRFMIRSLLGKGGFGVVYRAEDPVIRQVVALKVPRPDLVQNARLWNQLAREARVSARLHHPGIVRVYQAGLVDGTFHIASEYEAAEDLAKWLAKRPGALPARLAAELTRQLAEAVGHAHEAGIVHRDLKPANVLVIESVQNPGSVPRLKITDFGLGRVIEQAADDATATGHWQGSPPYMAPEQIIPGRAPIDGRADLYAIGAILYELLTGHPIYPARSLLDLHILLSRGEPPTAPRKLRPGVPADLETLAMACLEHDPARRPTAGELSDELSRHLDNLPIRLRPLPWPERLARYVRRKPTQAALIGVTAAGLVGLAALSASLARSNSEKETANRELRTAVERLDRAITSERQARVELLANEREALQAAYEAMLQRAANEVQAGRVESAQEHLNLLRPAPGEDDPRDFTWKLLMALATREYTVAPFFDLAWWRDPSRLPRDLPPRLELMTRLPGFSEIGPGFLQSAGHGGATRIDDEYWRLGHEPDHGGLFLEGTGRRYHLPVVGPNGVATITPDGRTLVLSGPDTLAPTDTPPPMEVGTVEIPTGIAGGPRTARLLRVPTSSQLAFSADGNTLAALAAARGIPGQIFPACYEIPRMGEQVGPTRSIFHPSRTRPERITWKSTEPPYPEHGFFSRMALSADGRLAAITGWEPRVEIFETWTGREILSLHEEDLAPDVACNEVRFSPDGRFLAVGGSGGRVATWEIRSGRKVGEFVAGTTRADCLTFYPDPETLAVKLHGEDRIRFWRIEGARPNPREVVVPPRLDDPRSPEVWGLAFARDGETIVSCDDHHMLRAFTAKTGEPESLAEPGQTGLMGLAVHPDGRRLAVIDYDGDLFTGSLDGTGGLERVEALGAAGRAIGWSPDGRRLLAAGKTGEVLLVGPEGKRSIPTPHRQIYAVAWSPGAKTLALGGHLDRSISLWDASTMALRATLPMPGDTTCLAFSPDGRQLVVGDTEGRLLFLDVASEGGKVIQIDRANEAGEVWAIAFSPDGRTVVTGGEDQMIRFWSPRTGHELASLKGHTAKVHALAFSPDGQTLASADFNGKILLWDTGGHRPLGDRPAPR